MSGHRVVAVAEEPAIDIGAVRGDLYRVGDVLHFNNAGAALMPRQVLQAVTNHLELEASIGGYEAAAREAGRLEAVYDDLAALIGADRDEIAITENATVAWSHAFYSLNFRPGDRILTSQAEYAANYVAFLQRAQEHDVTIEVVPNDPYGSLDVTALERMIDERTALIAITWIPTNGGLVNPAAEVGCIAEKYGVPYLLDACQALGQMPVDVRSLKCDFLSATGRKFLRAPRGTGLLYVRRSRLSDLQPAMIDHFGAPWVSRDCYRLRPDARRFETWENAYALRLGLGEAARYALWLGLPAIQKRAWMLADSLRALLNEVPALTLWDSGRERCAIVSFSVEGHESTDLVQRMSAIGINVSCSKPSSTLLDASARKLPNVVRASPHYYNTEEEVEQFVSALCDIIGN